ncbi:MAG: glycosyltransferase [Heliobacteriaceae bacterium]|nr:glycosyltransferase [Heliobacteriaceae bacterium]MDD4587597.1 glycosyltransferase [Heliobacteriaceae bacterium]
MKPLINAMQAVLPEAVSAITGTDIELLFSSSRRQRLVCRKNLSQHPVGDSDFGRLLTAMLDYSLGKATGSRNALENLFVTRKQQIVPDAWILYGLALAHSSLGNTPAIKYYLKIVAESLPEWNSKLWPGSHKPIGKTQKVKQLSLCMIVKNEERRLSDAVGPLLGICDQFVVVDTGSTDNTVELARSLGGEVYSFAWTGSFSDARNFALSKATGRWILIFDADMQISMRDGFVIKAWLKKSGIEGCFLPVLNYWGNEKPSAYIRDLIFILFRNRLSYRYEGKVHEQVVPSILRANPQAHFEICPVLIHHYGYLEPVKRELNKGKRNLNLLAAEKERNKEFVFYALAIEALQQNRFDDALALLCQAVTGADIACQPDILAKTVECLLHLGKYEEAEQEILRAIPKYPLYTDLYFILAQLLLIQNRLAEAEAALHVCLQRGVPPGQYSSLDGSGTFRAHLLLGQLYLTTGLKSQALAHLSTALGDPSFPDSEAVLEQHLSSLVAAEKEPLNLINRLVPAGHQAEDALQKTLARYAQKYLGYYRDVTPVNIAEIIT